MDKPCKEAFLLTRKIRDEVDYMEENRAYDYFDNVRLDLSKLDVELMGLHSRIKELEDEVKLAYQYAERKIT